MLFWWDLTSQWQNCLSPWTSREISQYRGAQVSLLATRALRGHLHTYMLLPVLADLTPCCVFILRTRMVLVYQLQGCFCSFACFVLSLTLLVVVTLCMILDRSFLLFCCFCFSQAQEKGLLHVTPSVFALALSRMKYSDCKEQWKSIFLWQGFVRMPGCHEILFFCLVDVKAELLRSHFSIIFPQQSLSRTRVAVAVVVAAGALYPTLPRSQCVTKLETVSLRFCQCDAHVTHVYRIYLHFHHLIASSTPLGAPLRASWRNSVLRQSVAMPVVSVPITTKFILHSQHSSF